MDEATTDLKLMEALARRDRGAMHLLYVRYAPLLVSLADRIIHDQHEAEEIVNEVLLELWRRADRFVAQRGSVRTYLMLVTRSRAIDRLRSRRSAGLTVHSSESDSPASALPAQEHNPVEHASLAELRRSVRSLLDGLPPDQRAAIELAFFEGLTHTEIAQRTGDPLGTVKGRIRLGLTRMRDGLRAHYQQGGSV